jgi:hypothetical protein
MVEELSIIAAAAMAISTGALLLLHIVPTGYNPIRDAVSDYAIGSYRALFWTFTTAGAISCVTGLVDGWLPWVITGTATATGLAIIGPRLKHIFGLIERSYYLSSITWFFVVSIKLARIGK